MKKFLAQVWDEMYLREWDFHIGACGLFTKNKERIQKYKETGD